jgi:hypothetical protein
MKGKQLIVKFGSKQEKNHRYNVPVSVQVDFGSSLQEVLLPTVELGQIDHYLCIAVRFEKLLAVKGIVAVGSFHNIFLQLNGAEIWNYASNQRWILLTLTNCCLAANVIILVAAVILLPLPSNCSLPFHLFAGCSCQQVPWQMDEISIGLIRII